MWSSSPLSCRQAVFTQDQLHDCQQVQSPLFFSAENVPVRNSDVDYRLLEAAKAGDLDTVKVGWLHVVTATNTVLHDKKLLMMQEYMRLERPPPPPLLLQLSCLFSKVTLI